MLIVAARAPGRFPTTITEIGNWWAKLENDPDTRAVAYDLNVRWWRVLCGVEAMRIAFRSLPATVAFRRRIELGAEGINAIEIARLAGASLESFRQEATFYQNHKYLDAFEKIFTQLDLLNRLQSECTLSFEKGADVRSVDYSSSCSLTKFALKESFLSRLIALALDDFPAQVGLVTFNITSPQDLLAAMIAARRIRYIAPAVHICLADHGYENYSLQPHMNALKAKAAFLDFFDTIIESKSDIDTVLKYLIYDIRAKNPPQGYLDISPSRAPIPTHYTTSMESPNSISIFESFTPRPVYSTRISVNRCYWNRCTFCAQNSKHVGKRAPEKSEIAAALFRLMPLLTSGIEDFIFTDEALSPSLLKSCRRPS